MKTIIILLAVFGMSGSAFAKPAFVKGAKCIACHTEPMGKKTNVSDKAKEMVVKNAGKKCADCHEASADGTKLVVKPGVAK